MLGIEPRSRNRPRAVFHPVDTFHARCGGLYFCPNIPPLTLGMFRTWDRHDSNVRHLLPNRALPIELRSRCQSVDSECARNTSVGLTSTVWCLNPHLHHGAAPYPFSALGSQFFQGAVITSMKHTKLTRRRQPPIEFSPRLIQAIDMNSEAYCATTNSMITARFMAGA